MASGPVSRDVRRITSSKRSLAAARRRLSKLTGPHDPHVVVDPRWGTVERALNRSGQRLFRRFPGVIGWGLSHRFRGSVETDEICITVFVRRKRTPQSLAKAGLSSLPATLRLGKRTIGIDVRELGPIKRRTIAFVGSSVGLQSRRTRGTIGAAAVDNATAATVALTAMHVVGGAKYPPGPVVQVVVPSLFDNPQASVFGRLLAGTRTDVDAAKITLDDTSSLLNAIPIIGKVRGWRPVHFPGDRGTPVRAYGAATAGLMRGVIVHPAIRLPSAHLRSAILVGGMTTISGDSGCALIDPENLVLGFLVGEASGDYEGLQVFCPAGLVLRLLQCDIPS